MLGNTQGDDNQGSYLCRLEGLKEEEKIEEENKLHR